ncbi:MAG: hypothetical protein AAFW00_13495 [Bacteroidota bacterium]
MAKLSGNTLIEVLTSLALLGIIFGIGITLVAKLGGIYAPVSQQWMEEQTYTFLQEPVMGEGIEEKEINGRILTRKIFRDDPTKDLVRVIVELSYQDRTMVKKQKWIFLEE